ncbi:DNA polymerase III subunit delta' [Propylenella binzhouense]|uniref:DNA polymerase III subunit delta n=1 Tax=Propylenella binzhouense TaxID=2555902 RepID=A0A964T3H1_9HYPH|nr:DNA polymerase III subunit delta' [Propylenella binzhouense]MYZ47234.1 DNA polymerase III subunit delta' [Propylenella binzhouense]
MARAAKPAVEQPPHDALDGVPLPRETFRLVGHAEAERELLSAYRSGRMHHAWLLAGMRGIGKATLAFRFARFVLSHPDPGSEAVARAVDLAADPAGRPAHLMAVGAHPNVLHLQRDWDERAKRHRTEISVGAVRRLIPFLGTTAGEGRWRFVIVDTADDLNRNAANALLKSLEEPPKETVFLILCESAGRLLPTIRSRCRLLTLGPLDDREAALVAGFGDLDPARDPEARIALALAGGSARRLIELREARGVELYRLLLRAIEGGDRSAMTRLGDTALDQRGGGYGQVLDLLLGYLHRRVRGRPEPDPGARPAALPLVTWAELWEKATLAGQEVETYNLDSKQFVVDLLETAAAAGQR